MRGVDFDNRGVDASRGSTIDAAARDAVLFLRTILKGFPIRKDPKQFLFFTGTEHGRREARALLERLKEGTDRRGEAVSPASFRAS
ncbi:hypothetical protein ABZ760_30780 [Streptomyces sp. NPDC006658]|uniref:hypothetical protein n=1 Tax=Streptomyces sp. NPDC006658 TaxID=3156900 RepID=UPI0033D40979